MKQTKLCKPISGDDGGNFRPPSVFSRSPMIGNCCDAIGPATDFACNRFSPDRLMVGSFIQCRKNRAISQAMQVNVGSDPGLFHLPDLHQSPRVRELFRHQCW